MQKRDRDSETERGGALKVKQYLPCRLPSSHLPAFIVHLNLPCVTRAECVNV